MMVRFSCFMRAIQMVTIITSLAVVYQCGLERDLETFDAGDSTEVGEKGLTLSGGQKVQYFTLLVSTNI